MFEAKIGYGEDALQPVLSSETIRFHYGKHHVGYATNLNKLIAGTSFESISLENIIIDSRNRDVKIFNNAAQLFNHDFYWKCLKLKGLPQNGPLHDSYQKCLNKKRLPRNGPFMDLINKQFGNFEKFQEEYISFAGGLFGSGWSWLVLDEKGNLKFINTQNAETPIGTSDIPLCVIDLWEHAYYIDYRNDRATYLQKIIENCVKWDFCESQMNKRN